MHFNGSAACEGKESSLNTVVSLENQLLISEKYNQMSQRKKRND